MFPSSSLRSAHFFLLLMLSSHLWMTRFHLGIASTHLSVPRHLLIHRMRLASLTSSSSHFAGVHFRLVSADVAPVALISGGLQLVSVFFGILPFSLPAMFSHFPWLVFTLSGSSFASGTNALSALTLPCAFALAIVFSHFPWLVFTLSCSGSLALALA
jgi:hypothetical protein